MPMRKPLLRLTFRQLQVFEAVCEARSYSRAADIMALTQPAVSLQVRQLEEVVGAPLFSYLNRTLYLTEAGEALRQTGRDLFARLGSLDMQLSDLRGALHGQLRLGVESSAQYLAPHLFSQFRRSLPQVDLALTVGNHTRVLRRLTENREDVALMSGVPSGADLEFLPLLDNAIVAVARPGHTLAGRKGLSLRELTAYPLLVREPGSGTRQACEDYLKQKRAHFAEQLEIGAFEAQREAVRAGLGLALLPRQAIRSDLVAGSLVELDVAELPLRRSWCVVHPRGKPLSPVAQAFVDYLRSQRSLINALGIALEPAATVAPDARPAVD